MLVRVLIATLLFAAVLAVMGVVSEWPRSRDRMTATGADPAAVVREHFRLDRPAALDDANAEAIYRQLRDRMRDQFARSGLAAAADYQGWRRHNRAPYRSATHGERFVNNYGNSAASDYGSGARMPTGAVLAKDAFTVTRDGQIHPATLALMEKMPPGFDPVGHDWRYALILPEGDIVGQTGDVGDEQVRFCRDCHRAAAETDFLFLVPDRFRAESPPPRGDLANPNQDEGIAR